MADLQAVQEANTRIRDLPKGLVAVCLGATSGIGRSALKEFVRYANSPRVYLVGRKSADGDVLVRELEQINTDAVYEFIEKDVSLVADTTAVAEQVKSKESHVDLLFLSAGFLSFSGRRDTAEGLDACMATRYYTRIRIIQQLLPLLNAAASPRVISVLAAGQETSILENDLDLRIPGNYTIKTSTLQTATMQTIIFERLATQNERIAFIHVYPGVVRTSALSRDSDSAIGLLMRYAIGPLVNTFFALNAEDVGARVVFYATNERYSVVEGSAATPLPPGSQKARRTKGKAFLVDAYGNETGDESLLQDFRARRVDEAVWTHTLQVFDKALATGHQEERDIS